MKYILPRDYLSASQINMYLRCPAQYEFRYIKQLIAPPAIVLLRGSAIHKGFEAYYQDILNGNKPMTPDQVFEYCVYSLEEMASEQDYKLEGEEKDGTVTELQHAAGPYIKYVAPQVQPIAVEQELRYTSRCGVEILGYIDLQRLPTEKEFQASIERCKAESRVSGLDVPIPEDPLDEQRICDYKFTKSKWAHNKLVNDLQFNLYAVATGVPYIEIHNLVARDKPAKLTKQASDSELAPVQDVSSGIRILRHDFDGREFDHVEHLIEGVAKGISAGIFPRCSMDSWCCDERFCGYYPHCRGSGR